MTSAASSENKLHNNVEADFADYFEDAPIALHRLSRDGVVLWANRMELDILGYESSEYVGRPLSSFAHPNDAPIVKQILEQLDSCTSRGGGGSKDKVFRDVPVRFLAKDGSIVYLLLNSNVRYDAHGNFDHVRCFIRDDTSRRIRDVRTKILLDETKRSRAMLDNFMSRSLHHLRTPLHVMEHTNDLLSERLTEWQQQQQRRKNGTSDDPDDPLVTEACDLVRESNHYVACAVSLIDDISDLARLDQGSEMNVTNTEIDVRRLALEVLDDASVGVPKNSNGSEDDDGGDVELGLELHDGAPAFITADGRILKRILTQLLDHAGEVTTRGGYITFSVSSASRPSRVKFEVEHAGIDIREAEREGDHDELSAKGKAGTLPPIFQRYHQELVPEELCDSDRAEDLRSKIETRMSAFHTTSLGIGLSLSYHLVHSLGGELRYQFRDIDDDDGTTELGATKFWFSIPCSPDDADADADGMELDDEDAACPFRESLRHEEISKRSRLGLLSNGKESSGSSARKHGRRPSSASSLGESSGSKKKIKSEVTDGGIDLPPTAARSITPPSSVASQGMIEVAPLVLIVEDTDICAKLIATVLRKMQIPSARARNGEEALDMLRSVPNGLYTLILMDLRMPVMDGFEATRAIKKYLRLDVPVIALTGETKEVCKELCEEIGFDGFISKPMKRKQLEEIVRKYAPLPNTYRVC